MKPASWRYAYASVVGTSHSRSNTPCQDWSACCLLHSQTGDSVLVAVIADGAGSAVRSHDGAELACELFIQEIRALIEGGRELADLDEDFCLAWLTHFQFEVEIRAQSDGLTSRDFACTFLGAVIGETCARFLQVGDGAIVVSCPDEESEYAWVFWPQKGDYENQTYFATEDTTRGNYQYAERMEKISEFALFTDGIQHLVLQYQTRTVHSPFFRTMFPPLYEEDGYSQRVSSALGSFLGSATVNERTDDDKTLLLATRRSITDDPHLIDARTELHNGEISL